jgi:hypothetical protein
VVNLRTWRFRSPLTSFGLSKEYIESIYEEMFLLKYHGGYSIVESYNMPIGLRRWTIERLVKQKQQEKEATEQASNKR